ncbi:hypothetical protein AB4Z18_01305 [Leifsonia sp. 2TAF2]|uniref:hypothetical protein n=1 Tax=Leifsonia sp. 2TAF2 TaxID=3233009 RepID=UPI003F97A311
MTLLLAVGLVSFASAAPRAEADTGVGSGGDGSLQLIPDVITNSGVSAGGSNEFPVKAELFLPAMDQRAKNRETAAAAITAPIHTVSFTPHLNPLFARDNAEVRRHLFTDYTPQALPSTGVDSAARSSDLWMTIMVVAALLIIVLAVLLGRKNAARRMSKHARATR